MIDELADEIPSNVGNNIELTSKIDTNSTEVIQNNLSNDTIQEIESIISEKRMQAKKYLINANRAKRASDSLSCKADEVNKEIELYENKLRACK